MPLTMTQIRKRLPGVLERVVGNREPEIIVGQNEPRAVILDYATYNIYLSLADELEEKGRYLDAVRQGQGKKGISLSSLKRKYNLK